MTHRGTQPLKSVEISRRIIRADGVPRPGDEEKVVAYWHKNPFKRFAVRRLRSIKGKVKIHARSSTTS